MAADKDTGRRTPLNRSTTPIPRNVRPKAKRAGKRRVSVLRDRKFLDWLRERDCTLASLGIPHRCCLAVDPAHGPPVGLRVKGPDNEAIPLCRNLHMEQTDMVGGWKAFEDKYGFSRAEQAKVFWTGYLIVSGKLPEGEKTS